MIKLLQLAIVFMKIGALAFGGAYASIPLIEKEIVEINGWMSYQEFSDLLALDELTPGPMILNSSTFVGMHLFGFKGALVATISAIIPSFIISFVLVKLYEKYKSIPIISELIGMLKCMTIALIASTCLSILLKVVYPSGNLNCLQCLLVLISLFVLRKYKPNPLLIMIATGSIYLLFSTMI